MKTEQKIEEGKKPTLADIEYDLNNDHWDALYFATEKQVDKLINQNRIDEDFGTRHQDYQEEMRIMVAEC